MNDFATLRKHLLDRHPVEQHALFTALGAGTLSSSEVSRLALQIYHVVDHFPRFLAALLSNIPDSELRMPLVENLYEEHGRMNPARVHVETYRAFLNALGIPRAVISASRPALPVIVYTRAVMDLCLHHSHNEGLAALAAIEETVARASLIVGRYAASRGIDPQQRGHFSDHETLDLRHADELYDLAQRSAEGPRLSEALRGLELGFYYHHRLYSDLHHWLQTAPFTPKGEANPKALDE